VYIHNLNERHSATIAGALVKEPANRIPTCAVLKDVLSGKKSWKVNPIAEKFYQNEAKDYPDNTETTLPIPKKTPPARAPSLEELHTVISPVDSEQAIEEKAKKHRAGSSPLLKWIGSLAVISIAFLVFFSEQENTPARAEYSEATTPTEKTETDQSSLTQTATKTERKNTNSSTTTQVKSKPKTQVKSKSKSKTKRTVKTRTKQKTTQTQSKTKVKSEDSPTKTTMARLSFSGAKSIRLQGARGSYRAGSIPPGTYTIYAVFDSKEIKVGQVTLHEGEKRHLTCNAMYRCE